MMTKISRSILAMCMCCALNFKALAVSDLPPNFKQLESQALKYLDDKKIDNEKRSALYLLAGREFYSYGLLDKSEEYYLKALNLNSSGKKAEAYINLVAIAVDNGNKDKTLKRFNSAEKYFKEHSNEKDSGVSLWLKTMDRVLRTPGKGSYRYTGLYGHYAALSDLRNFIEKRQYAKALSILNPTSISEASSPVVLISYDILRVLVHGKVEKKTLNSNHKCNLLSDRVKTS